MEDIGLCETTNEVTDKLSFITLHCIEYTSTERDSNSQC